ncbi:hypothetical protein EVAR_11401_1 [Eumeta japonica]|uniref:Uncharacterized protein n=1 Tax=Eumeta variegata TaxID=151549 RepID=A0A4C1TM15_EUMVA|nr:hypothetical protein EVAR_11401_1 [Eumeta japonica]
MIGIGSRIECRTRISFESGKESKLRMRPRSKWSLRPRLELRTRPGWKWMCQGVDAASSARVIEIKRARGAGVYECILFDRPTSAAKSLHLTSSYGLSRTALSFASGADLK